MRYFVWIVALAVWLMSAAGAKAYYLDTPHNESNGIYCATCHNSPAFKAGTSQPANIDDTRRNAVCLQCHIDSPAAAFIPFKGPVKKLHASSTTSAKFGQWSTECTQCHDVHYQGQLDWDGDPDLYLATGTVAADNLPYNSTTKSTTVAINTPVANPLGSGWDNTATWVAKGGHVDPAGAVDNSRGLIFVPDRNNPGAYEIVAATPTSVTVKGKMTATSGAPYGVIYGQSIKSFVLPNGGKTVDDLRPVRFYRPEVVTNTFGGYVDETAGATKPAGLCQVCHTDPAMVWKKSGEAQTHHAGENCGTCHNILNGGGAANSAPVAAAGPDQNVTLGAVVTLDGSTSSDADSDPLNYSWTFSTQPGGSSALLFDANTSAPHFAVDAVGTFVVQLIVNDGTQDSVADTVSITVAPLNTAPVAAAGPDQEVVTGALVTLDGSASSDADSDPLTYSWAFTSLPAGSSAVLAGANTANPTFAADLGGTYVVTLIVNDGSVDSPADTVSIVANTAPVAAAGPDQNVTPGAPVALSGSGSSDADGDPLSYSWAFTSLPLGSGAVLSDATTSGPTFTADLAGSYLVRLIVNDGKVDSGTDTVTITANTVPVAAAGADQNVAPGALVTLDGSASGDADGDPLSYSWEFSSLPAGSGAGLSGPATVGPTFTADVAGTYVVQLIVNDGKAASPADTVTIVANTAPVAEAGVEQKVGIGSLVTMDGSSSSDADGDLLSYSWVLTSKPPLSSATLADANTAGPSFTAEVAGMYGLSLIVNDGKVDSAAATVSIVVTSTPRFAYAVNNGSGTVSAYTVDNSTGSLRHNGYLVTEAGPQAVTVDPYGRFAYVAAGTNKVAVYTINQSTGALTAGTAVAAGNYPRSVTVDPSGRFAYAANNNGTVSVYTIDQSTGALTAGTTVAAGTAPSSVTVDPSGRFAYVANNNSNNVSVYTINLATGALTAGTSVAAGTTPRSVTVDPTGRFVYVANAGSSNVSVYTINQSTGALTAGTAVAVAGGAFSVTVDPSGRFAYVANAGSNTVTVYTINQSTGALTAGTAVATGGYPQSVVVDPSGIFAYVANFNSDNVSVFTINQTTGALTFSRNISTQANPISLAMTGGTAPVTYVPKFAYAANQGTNNVSVYAINPATGALTAGTAVATGAQPRSVAVDPMGRFAYAANAYSNTVSVYTVNPSTGALTAGTAVAAGTNPFAVTVDPSGRFAYAANSGSNNVSVFTINQTTGALTAGTAVAAGTYPFGVTVDPGGRVVYTANRDTNDISVYYINQSTGALTARISVASGYQPFSLTVDPTGRFAYAACFGSNNVWVYTIDQASGYLTAGTAVAAGTNPFSVTVDPTGRFAYAANYGSANVSVYTINQTTGALTAGTPVATGSAPASVTVDPSGKFAYVANANSNNVWVYTINQTTGALTAGTAVATGTTPLSVTTSGVIQ